MIIPKIAVNTKLVANVKQETKIEPVVAGIEVFVVLSVVIPEIATPKNAEISPRKRESERIPNHFSSLDLIFSNPVWMRGTAKGIAGSPSKIPSVITNTIVEKPCAVEATDATEAVSEIALAAFCAAGSS